MNFVAHITKAPKYFTSSNCLELYYNMSFVIKSFRKSPTSGRNSRISCLFGMLYVWGSLCLAIYIMAINIYVPFISLSNNDTFDRKTTIALTCLHALLLAMVAWSYFRTRFTNPGNIPRPHKLTREEVHALEAGDKTIATPTVSELFTNEFSICKKNGNMKYCRTCQIYRPARTSHCPETGRCVAKFDHYCPAISSAIGVRNYKYYIHFLFYTSLLTIYLQTMGFLGFFKVQKSTWFIILSVGSSIIANTTLLPLLILHGVFMCNNVTTKEDVTELTQACPGRRRSHSITVRCNVGANYLRYGELPSTQDWDNIVIVDLDLKTKPWKRSTWENWSGVMGINWWEWILPIPATLEGHTKWWEFEFNDSTKEDLRKRAGDKMRSVSVRMQESEYQRKLSRETEESDTALNTPRSIAQPEKAFIK